VSTSKPLILREELERIAAERLATERLAVRATRRALAICLAQVVGFCFLGLVMMFFAFWVADEQLGRALLYAGMAVGYAGMAWSLLRAYVKAEERGDI
jgi:xanthine dehydrogenase iron-sulfur cluster and FAD-binding subunit A